MCGRNPAHYAEYWKAVQEMWLRLYLSNLVLVAAINVSVPTPEWLHRTGWDWGLWPCSRKALSGEGDLGETIRRAQVSLPLHSSMTW